MKIKYLRLPILRREEPRMFVFQNAEENPNAAMYSATITVFGQGY